MNLLKNKLFTAAKIAFIWIRVVQFLFIWVYFRGKVDKKCKNMPILIVEAACRVPQNLLLHGMLWVPMSLLPIGISMLASACVGSVGPEGEMRQAGYCGALCPVIRACWDQNMLLRAQTY